MQTKACSGKCLGMGCSTPGVWVVAACEGKISLFEKFSDGHMRLIPQGEGSMASSLEFFHQNITLSAQKHLFSQLVIIGSPADLSWLRAVLPLEVAKLIVAEIQYPLLPRWFEEETASGSLRQKLEHLFQE